MKNTDTKRRKFIVALGLGGLGAAAALLGQQRRKTAEAALPQASAPQPSQGYHVSEHVETYYRKARI